MNHIHTFEKSEFPDYEKCTGCGSYHSTALLPPDDVYVNVPYWGDGTGRSTLEQQFSNHNCIDDCGISKVDRVMQFVPKGDVVIEAACAPGALLKKLIEFGYKEVIGVEPAHRYVDFICHQAPGAKVVIGYFPDVVNPELKDYADCFVALDLAEHIEDYDTFFKAIHKLLKPGGTGIIMSPIILHDGLFRKIDFQHPDEHAWIWTQTYLNRYLQDIFSEVKFTRWIVGHELVIFKK